jgi:hypothetical protein
MKRKVLLLNCLALTLAACGGDAANSAPELSQVSTASQQSEAVAAGATVALAGNAFITSAGTGATEIINANGLANWTNANTVVSSYFRVASAGQVTVSIDAKVGGGGSSKIQVTVNGTPFTVNMSGGSSKTYAVGTVNVPAAGYVKVDLKGVTKSGGYFGDVSALKVSTAATLNYANDAANYYWSRRGPSVHMGYTAPANTEYFYNEMTIPVGQDKIGSYFMANGFSGGYMGIQVKSTTERWILFSVWDAENGAKTTLVGKGPGVVDNGFGGEGTGGQSYLVYNWIAGNTYKFITRAKPDSSGGTDFSSWFFAPETGTWRYIATWKRPATVTYLTSNHSFLENFIDTNGYMERKVLFGNQWARSASGTWTELTAGRYTGDATASNAQRMDYAGGLDSGKFYLRNGGFFATPVPINQNFTRPATGQMPTVNVSTLPQ